MNTKLKSWLLQLLQSPRRFPVELALGLVFFVIAVCDTRGIVWHQAQGQAGWGVNGDVLWLFAPLLVLTFWLQRVNRWAYYASFFLFLPLMALNLKPFLWTYGFGFTYVLAAILLVVGNRPMDNRSFASHALHVVGQLFLGLLITGILNLAVMAIVASFLYIFGIDTPRHLYEHIVQFVWFVLAPQVCCTFIRQGEDSVGAPSKALGIIVNYILSPAVIIYTVILYAYFVKIVVQWDLPKGGVAWMVMGFIAVALVGCMVQSVVGKRYYDWFYRHFTLIAVAPLILFWAGSVYRIGLYNFTESRFYLMVAGVLMTLFVLMLLTGRTRRYQWMALIFAAAIFLFTYIPGISAKSIGLRSQQQRLSSIIGELRLADAATGKLNDSIDTPSIVRDSLLCAQYRDACSVIGYVRSAMGTEAFGKRYGQWTHSEYEFNYDKGNSSSATGKWHDRLHPVNLDQYSVMLPAGDYRCNYDQHRIVVTDKNESVVLEYPIDAIVGRDPSLLRNPEQLLTCRNDSIMLVLDGILIDDTIVASVNTCGFSLFKKPSK